jgi:hypothetical protein
LSGNLTYFYSDLKKEKSAPVSASAARSSAGATLTIPFKEDFYYASTQSYPDQKLWMDSSTYVNTGHAIAPPSIGVATFDGLNKYGFPYKPDLLNLNNSLPADTLRSRPINLLVSGTQTLQPSDSVALIFYYQARGNGDSPESIDSLILDFYKPGQNKWTSRVWWSRGNSSPNTNDTVFKRAFVWISDPEYLLDGFQFRFRNKATTAGDFDHWHLDYIYLDKGRSQVADTAFDDVAFGYVPSPLLTKYAAMPWEQYHPSERASAQSVFIRNNGVSAINMSYENRLYDNLGALTYSYNGGANPGLEIFDSIGWSKLTPHAKPAFTHTFAAFTDSIDFRFKHNVYRSGSSNDFFPGNDTVVQYQRFRNYYAFDDGSAEGAYFVAGQGVRILQRIVLNYQDTLRAVRVYFDPIGNYANPYNFRIDVLTEQGSLPGALLYRDSTRSAKYLSAGFNATPEYTLTSPVLLPAGIYYIGIKQEIASGIGIGFDKNLNHMTDLYYNSGSGFTQSQIPGSLMMRPVFGKKVPPPPVGITESENYIKDLSVFPNPANELINLKSVGDRNISYELLDLTGRVIDKSLASSATHSIHSASIAPGVYFLVIRSGNLVDTRKVVVQH